MTQRVVIPICGQDIMTQVLGGLSVKTLHWMGLIGMCIATMTQ